MKRIVVLLAVGLGVLLVGGASADSPITKDGLERTSRPGAEAVDAPENTRVDWIPVTFNTGGTWFQTPDLTGSASGWASYFLHVYTHFPGPELWLTDFWYPTNTYSTDPVSMPVDWVVDIGNDDVLSILDPYTHYWSLIGSFTPEGALDTVPPDTYTHIELPDLTHRLASGESMVWGYENAGLAGMTEYGGETTYGWFYGVWEPDDFYGRTALMQFRGEYWQMVPVEGSSLSRVKSLY